MNRNTPSQSTHPSSLRWARVALERTFLACLVLSLALAGLTVTAQTFSSGSDGSYGAINITDNTTLDVPPNGIFNCTTIKIAAFRSLKFRRNAANTPIYLLATGDISINGTLDVNGAAGNGVVGGLSGPGGFDGGSPGSVSVQPGAGYGPGAGAGGGPTIGADGAGGGSFGTVATSGNSTGKGKVYGNALIIPMVGGSGGGGTTGTPGVGGGGGGGGIVIASTTRIEISSPGGSAFVLAQGGNGGGGAYNGGSGGAIRLVAPVVIGSGAQLHVEGPSGAGDGRIRIDAIDRSQMSWSMSPAQVASVGSLMLVFPTPTPKLNIIEAAGTAIAEGAGPVTVLLPFGSSPNRTIKIQARDFNSVVPLTVALTPDHGPASSYTGKVDNTGANNPAVASIDVVLPVNEQTTINVYSK